MHRLSSGMRPPEPPKRDPRGLPLYALPSPSPSDSTYSPATNTSPSFQDPDLEPGSPRYNAQAPPPSVLLDGYKQDLGSPNGYSPTSPYTSMNSFNGVNGIHGSSINGNTKPSTPYKSRPQSSALLNTNDPVAMHLLHETALTDSRTYPILSFEEMEELKHEHSMLASRIEAVRRKLALESKVRDAAQSLNRLYSTKKRPERDEGKLKKHRRSMAGSRGSVGSLKEDTLGQTEDELAASTKRCEELARELWELERRFGAVDARLLRHTAGVLQMNREATTSRRSKDDMRNGGQGQGLGFSNVKSKGSPEFEDGFDDRSLYRSADHLDGFSDGYRRSHSRSPSAYSFGRRSQSMEIHNQTVLAVQKRLAELNDRMRDLIVQVNPSRNQSYAAVPRPASNGVVPQSQDLEQQLNYLTEGLKAIGAENAALQQKSRHSQNAVEGRLEGLNNQIYRIIGESGMQSEPPFPPPPEISGQGEQAQVSYLEEGLYTIEQLHAEMIRLVEEARRRSTGVRNQSEQYQKVMLGLWETIKAAEAEARQRKNQRRQMLQTNPDADDGSDMSPDEDSDGDDKFSLEAFTSKVRYLHRRATNLKEQQGILKRQIRQQRELNSKSDAQKDLEFAEMNGKLRQAHEMHAVAEKEAAQLRDQLERTLDEIDELTDMMTKKEQENAAQGSKALQAERAAWGEEEETLRLQIKQHEGKIASLEAYISGAVQAEREARKEAEEELLADLHARQEQITQLEHDLADLEDDAQIHKAELSAQAKEHEEEIQKIVVDLQAANKQRAEVEAQLADTRAEHAKKIAAVEALHAKAEDEVATARADHAETAAALEALQAKTAEEVAAARRERKASMDALSVELAELSKELQATENAKAQAETELTAVQKQLSDNKEMSEKREAELRELESEIVRLTTELTMAKAELDSAYGSRAQRAAEVAANPEIKKELEELKERNTSLSQQLEALQQERDKQAQGSSATQERMQTLQQELSETITDYESLTRASIEAEKEREQLEVAIDGLRDRCETLETQLADEKVRWMGIRSPGFGESPGSMQGGLSETTSTSVLKTEFKKMMRELRMESSKALRAEQEERRKLEALLRTLRREQSLGKSSNQTLSV